MTTVETRVAAAALAARWRRRLWGSVSGAILVAASYAWATGIGGLAVLVGAVLAGAWMVACGWAWWQDRKLLLTLCAALWGAIVGWLLPSGTLQAVLVAGNRSIATSPAAPSKAVPPTQQPPTAGGGSLRPSPEALRRVW